MNFKFLIDHLPQFQEESQEFDRLDEYSPGDDIRRIDWKATARSVTLTPKVRKYNRPYGVKVGLVMDMRLIQKESFQHKWAQDIAKFINVYNTISAGSCLDRLIFIKGDGTIHEFRVSMIMSGNTFSITEKILAKIMELWKELSAQSFVFPLNGVQFYTDKENFQYMHFINLTDFGQQAKSDVQFHRISAKRLNIFAIGVRREERHNIDMIIGQENKLFYW
ncbi:MAG: DUF58 domain-containing protein [Candidatus Omnitrophica bacterium]|nr:DUF58 domain-containing protein [Candidatus Omnitrophota bacterium]